MKGKLERRLSLGREKSSVVCSQEGGIHGPSSVRRLCEELVHGLTTQKSPEARQW